MLLVEVVIPVAIQLIEAVEFQIAGFVVL